MVLPGVGACAVDGSGDSGVGTSAGGTSGVALGGPANVSVSKSDCCPGMTAGARLPLRAIVAVRMHPALALGIRMTAHGLVGVG